MELITSWIGNVWMDCIVMFIAYLADELPENVELWNRVNNSIHLAQIGHVNNETEQHHIHSTNAEVAFQRTYDVCKTNAVRVDHHMMDIITKHTEQQQQQPQPQQLCMGKKVNTLPVRDFEFPNCYCLFHCDA